MQLSDELTRLRQTDNNTRAALFTEETRSAKVYFSSVMRLLLIHLFYFSVLFQLKNQLSMSERKAALLQRETIAFEQQTESLKREFIM